ncbi:hypothetical protein LEP1GSC125_2738 [Leptospira mayottensis 200901122]|uniref:Uncharacterized protein n=1 Tax=Leptospira mayottensis 200901122 TaxID=1193010 RepID=A0AA87MNS9_9LEPT|nr:hypothetical protein LEP1GSC125_2738 [Leptospira mayottensis 200901122]
MYLVVERSGLPIGSTTISNSFVLSKTFLAFEILISHSFFDRFFAKDLFR